MSSKIVNSDFKEHIDNVLLNDIMSLGELEKDLLIKGFKVSKSTLGSYAKELKASENTSNMQSYDVDYQNIIDSDSIVNYAKRNKDNKLIIQEMYDMALKSAYKVTKNATNNGKVLPLNLYKSIVELQRILKGQSDLS